MVFPTSENTSPDISLDALPSTSKEIEVDSPTIVTANSPSSNHDSTVSGSAFTGTPSNSPEPLGRALKQGLRQERQQNEHPEAVLSRSALPNGGTSSDATDQLICLTPTTTSADSIRNDSNPLTQLLSAQNRNARRSRSRLSNQRYSPYPIPTTLSASYDNRDRPSAYVTPAPSRMPACQGNENAPRPKSRHRARVSPVWKYFDIRNGLAYCHNCPYSTKSAFSTNLKSHMKTHHKRQHAEVLEMEEVMGVKGKKKCTRARVPGPASRFESGFGMPYMSAQGETPGLLATTHPTIASSLFPRLVNDSGPKRNNADYDNSLQENNRKRHHTKRHPVWKYFRPADNGKFQCTDCGTLGSGYTTNLKSHLKYHHELAHIEVLMAEVERAQNKESPVHKKRRADILQERENVHNLSLNQTDDASFISVENVDNEDSGIATSASTPDLESDSSRQSITPNLEQPQVSGESFNTPSPPELSESSDITEEQKTEALRFLMQDFRRNSVTNPIYVGLMQLCRQHVIGNFINFMGPDSFDFFKTPQFQRLVACLDPDFQLPSDTDTLLAWAQSARRQQ